MTLSGTSRSLLGAALAFLLLCALSTPSLLAEKKDKTDSTTRTISGSVVDKAGNPLPRAVVQLKNTKNLQIVSQFTDEGGQFHFRNLNTNTDYEVQATHEGASSNVRTVSSFDSRKEVFINLKISKK